MDYERGDYERDRRCDRAAEREEREARAVALNWIPRDATPDTPLDALDDSGVRYIRNAAGDNFTAIVPHATEKRYGKGCASTLAEAVRLATAALSVTNLQMPGASG